MSEKVTVLIKEVKEGASGEGQYGPWTRYDVIDGNEDRWPTFKEDVAKAARLLIGKRAELEFERGDRGVKLLSLMPVPEEPEKPPLGTGQYITGSKSETDRIGMASMNASTNATAMTEAVLKFQTGREITLELYQATWDSMFLHCFRKVLTANGIDWDDVPF